MMNGMKVCFLCTPLFLCDKFIINQATMEITSTEKGKNKIARNGYSFVFKKMLANDLRCFECELTRKGNQYKAKIKLDIADEIIGEVNLHAHAPSQMQIEVAKLKANIKRKAQRVTDTPQQILGAEVRNISQDASVNIPSTSTLKRNIRKAREDNDVPHNPMTREDITVLLEQCQNIVAGEPLLIYCSGVRDQKRMFIFALEIGLHFLTESEDWYADGTFKVCRKSFYKLYTIHGKRNRQIFPAVFCLLPNKSQTIFRRMLQQRYNEGQEFTLQTRILYAVAFMPPDNAIVGFEEQSDLIRGTYQDQMNDLLDFVCVKSMEYVPYDISRTLLYFFLMFEDGTGVCKLKFGRAIPSFGCLLIFFELKKT